MSTPGHDVISTYDIISTKDQYKRGVTILESFSFELIALQVGECRSDPQVGKRFYLKHIYNNQVERHQQSKQHY